MNENNVNKVIDFANYVLEHPKLNQIVDEILENKKIDLLLKKRELELKELELHYKYNRKYAKKNIFQIGIKKMKKLLTG